MKHPSPRWYGAGAADMDPSSALTQAPRLLALDWGTSALRAFALGSAGEVLAERRSAHGVMHLPALAAGQARSAAFEQALQGLCGDWLEAYSQAPLLACGMVGSAQGWQEAAYLPVPLPLNKLNGRLSVVDRGRGQPLHIIPGLLQDGALPNVMRGEETQIVGVLQHLAKDSAAPASLVIGLPGTHCKWVWVQGDCVQHFATFMTGEIFATVRAHTILGRTMETSAGLDQDAFVRGLRVARSNEGSLGLLSNLFSCRTLGLTGQLGPAAQSEYLSGLLIGHELHALSQAQAFDLQHPVVLCGEAALCQRYAMALEIYGFDQPIVYTQVTALGLWGMALAAGLV